jgi:hypothetical protein
MGARGKHCLFGSHHWADSFARSDALGRALSVWVGPLEILLENEKNGQFGNWLSHVIYFVAKSH